MLSPSVVAESNVACKDIRPRSFSRRALTVLSFRERRGVDKQANSLSLSLSPNKSLFWKTEVRFATYICDVHQQNETIYVHILLHQVYS